MQHCAESELRSMQHSAEFHGKLLHIKTKGMA
jgi:hypothetical protein